MSMATNTLNQSNEERATVSAPIHMTLELTRRCNLECFYCKTRDNNSPNPAHFTIEHFKKIIDKLVKAGVFEVSFSGGEPFLHPGILEIARYARDNELTVSFLSNGTLIKKNEIKEITKIFNAGCTIALNGLENYHDRFVGKQGMFKRTTRTIKRLLRENFPIGIDTVISRSNLDQLDDFLFWVSENMPTVSSILVHFFVSYNGLRSEEILSFSQIYEAFNIIDKYNKSILKNKVVLGIPVPFCAFPQKFEYLRWGCAAGWMFGAINPAGTVRICTRSEDILGNIMTTSLNKIWIKGPKIESFRSFNWLSNEQCASCAYLYSCAGSCKVTSPSSFYSVPDYWKSQIRAKKQDLPNNTSAKNIQTGSVANRYIANKNFRIRREKNGSLIYLKNNRRYYWLNDTALYILRIVQSGSGGPDEIIRRLLEAYEVDEETAKNAVMDIIPIFERMGIISPINRE